MPNPTQSGRSDLPQDQILNREFVCFQESPETQQISCFSLMCRLCGCRNDFLISLLQPGSWKDYGFGRRTLGSLSCQVMLRWEMWLQRNALRLLGLLHGIGLLVPDIHQSVRMYIWQQNPGRIRFLSLFLGPQLVHCSFQFHSTAWR